MFKMKVKLFYLFSILIGVLLNSSCDPKVITTLNNGSNPIVCMGVNCLAAGYYLKSQDGNFLPYITQSINAGRSFDKAIEPALPAGATIGGLTGIDCTYGKRCIGVGYYQTSSSSNPMPLIVQSNDAGATFSKTTPAALPKDAVLGVLIAITCKGLECYAVGYYQQTPTGPTLPYVVVSSDAGLTFDYPIATAMPENGVIGALLAITCAGQECIAVGYYRTSLTGPILPLIVQSDNQGKSFPFAEQPPLPPEGIVGQLVGITCIGSECTTVGFYQKIRTPPPAHLVPYPLAIHSIDGGKTFTNAIETPMPPNARIGSLGNITCTQEKCIAVGLYQTAPIEQNLFQPYIVESYDYGRTFVNPVQPPYPAGGIIGGLIGITCTGNSCITVGDYKKTEADLRLPLVIQSADGGNSFLNSYQSQLPNGGVLGVLGTAVLLSTE